MVRGFWRPFGPLVDGLGRLGARTRIPPTGFTVLALVVTFVAAALIGMGRSVTGALVATVGVSLDFVDGAVARRTGKVSAVGGYLDSLFDRYADFALLFAVGVAYDQTRMWWAVGPALFGVLMTSAARWRVHEDRVPPGDAWGRGLLERPERLLVLLVGVFVQGVLDLRGVGIDVLFVVVVVLAVFANLTVVQRMRAAVRLLREG